MAGSVTANTSVPGMRVAVTCFFFISGFSYAAWASRIPTIKDQLHLSDAQLGSILFALPVGLMVTLPFTKHFLGRISSRAIMFTGAIAFNITLCFTGMAAAAWQLAILLFFFGSSRNLLNLSANAQAVSLQKLYPKSIITSFHAIWSLAGFAGAALGYIMVSCNIGTRWHLLAVGIGMLILSFLFYPATLYEAPVPQERKPVFSLPDKTLINFSIIAFIGMACENTMYDWSGIFFEKVVHSSARATTLGFVIYMVAMTSGRVFGDALVNRFGIKRILHYCGIFITVGLSISVLLPYPVTAGIGFLFTGLGVSCVIPLVLSMTGRAHAANSSSAVASVSTIGYLGFLMVPPLIGFVAQWVGIRVAFGTIAVLAGAMIYMVSRLREGNGDEG